VGIGTKEKAAPEVTLLFRGCDSLTLEVDLIRGAGHSDTFDLYLHSLGELKVVIFTYILRGVYLGDMWKILIPVD
jgi:hypothetical protein